MNCDRTISKIYGKYLKLSIIFNVKYVIIQAISVSHFLGEITFHGYTWKYTLIGKKFKCNRAEWCNNIC